jgi:uncharacterized protein (UPF0332 family)
MDEQARVLIEVRLARAHEDIETARELFNSGRYRAVVNRSYYAIFSVTTALLLTQRIERSKHAGVESAFTPLLHKDAVESTAYPHKKAVSTLLRIRSKGHSWIDPGDDIDLTAIPLWVRV